MSEKETENFENNTEENESEECDVDEEFEEIVVSPEDGWSEGEGAYLFEEEIDEDVQPIEKIRHCIRRRKKKKKKVTEESIFAQFEDEGSYEEEESKKDFDSDKYKDEDEEDEEEEDGEEDAFEGISESSSDYYTIYSAIPFEWEGKCYEFLDLCDPGTMEEIFEQHLDEYEIDYVGKRTYLTYCAHLQVTPVLRFYNNLDANTIDLTHYGINKKQMRAMGAALEQNIYVEELILKQINLSVECCKFLSKALERNRQIAHLNLSNCRIGPEGCIALVPGIDSNRVLRILNLKGCRIGDEGVERLVTGITSKNVIEELILSYNSLGAGAAEALGELLSVNTTIKDLDLTYNNLYDPTAMTKFFKGLTNNTSVTSLSLRWNAISEEAVVNALVHCLRRNLVLISLDLSDNRLDTVSVKPLRAGIANSKSLEVLRLGRNPIGPADAVWLLNGVYNSTSMKLLDLSDVWVGKDFVKILQKIRASKEIAVEIGGIYSNYVIHGPDYPALIMKRAKFEAMKPKKVKKRKDFGHLMYLLGDEPLTEEEFQMKVKKFKAKVNKALYPELIKQFIIRKKNLIDVVAMREKYLSLFPDTVPPEPSKPKKGDKSKDKKTKIDQTVTKAEEKKPEKAQKKVEKVHKAHDVELDAGMEDEEEEEEEEEEEDDEDEEDELYEEEDIDDEEAVEYLNKLEREEEKRDLMVASEAFSNFDQHAHEKEEFSE